MVEAIVQAPQQLARPLHLCPVLWCHNAIQQLPPVRPLRPACINPTLLEGLYVLPVHTAMAAARVTAAAAAKAAQASVLTAIGCRSQHATHCSPATAGECCIDSFTVQNTAPHVSHGCSVHTPLLAAGAAAGADNTRLLAGRKAEAAAAPVARCLFSCAAKPAGWTAAQ